MGVKLIPATSLLCLFNERQMQPSGEVTPAIKHMLWVFGLFKGAVALS